MDSAETLEVWTVSTFNVVAFGLLGVVAVHVSGEMANLLRGLSTLEGVLVFAYLWVLAFFATRWAFTDGGLERIRIGEFSSLLVRGALAGAAIGAGFLVGVVLAAVAVRSILEPTSFPGVQVGSFVFLVSAAGGIAALVGGVVGVVFVLFDALLYRVSMYFLSRTAT